MSRRAKSRERSLNADTLGELEKTKTGTGEQKRAQLYFCARLRLEVRSVTESAIQYHSDIRPRMHRVRHFHHRTGQHTPDRGEALERYRKQEFQDTALQKASRESV